MRSARVISQFVENSYQFIRRQVGGAVTSCVGRLDVGVVYRSVPGVGVVHAQASLNTQGRDRAQLRLTQGTAVPATVSAHALDALFDEISSPGD